MSTPAASSASLLLALLPCSYPNRPYQSVPTLAGYLRQQGIPVGILDANLAFFNYIFEKARLEAGIAHGKDRLRTLNNQAQLNFAEMCEYNHLANIFRRAAPLLDKLPTLLQAGLQLPLPVRDLAVKTGAELALSPWFPEGINEQHGSFFLAMNTNPYSSRQLLDRLQSPFPMEDFFQELLVPLFKENPPDILGLSVIFPEQMVIGLKMAAIAKKLSPSTHITLGGPYISLHASTVQHTRFFDLIDSMVVGDGEIPLKTLVHELGGAHPDLSRVPGLVYCHAGHMHRNPPAPALAMKQAPLPDYSDYPTDRYYLARNEHKIGMRLSRGCSWARCAFCRTLHPIIRDYQQLDANDMFERVRAIVQQTGAREFVFSDDEADPVSMALFSERLIAEKMNIQWTINMRFDARLTLERCRLYRQSGCTKLIFGLESYNDRLLKLIRKGTSVRLIHQVLSNLAWAGLPCGVYMIVGLPTETEAEARAAFAGLLELISDGSIDHAFYAPFTIFSDSPIAEAPGEFGISSQHCPADLDLSPPILEFESSGMGARTAIALAQEFGAAIHDVLNARSSNRATISIREVVLDGTPVRLRYDIQEIESLRMQHVQPIISFHELLACNKNLPPIHPTQ